MAKISSFIVSILLVGFFVTVFGAYFANIATHYPVTYDNTTNASLQTFNQLTELQTVTEELNQTLLGTPSGESGVTDLIGKFLGSGFNALKIAAKSFTSFFTIAANAVENLGLPTYFLAFIALICLVILLFIIIGAIIGRDI